MSKVVFMVGPNGVGKTHIREMFESIGFASIKSSAVILQNHPNWTATDVPFDDDGMNEMMKRRFCEIPPNACVVVDGYFRTAAQYVFAMSLMRQQGRDVYVVVLMAPDQVCEERIVAGGADRGLRKEDGEVERKKRLADYRDEYPKLMSAMVTDEQPKTVLFIDATNRKDRVRKDIIRGIQ